MSDDEDRRPSTALAQVLEQNVAVVIARLRSEPDAASPVSALLSARTVAEAIEQVTRELVDQSRADGHTWQEIGQLLSISRQAAQQRFRSAPAAEEHAKIALRAAEVVNQMDAGSWESVTADWDEVMLSEVGVKRLTEAWRQIISSAGALQTIGQSSIVRKGPYRIADVPLIFTHGPMKARVVFSHEDKISGLFVLLPDAE